jgi:hypothetical protein
MKERDYLGGLGIMGGKKLKWTEKISCGVWAECIRVMMEAVGTSETLVYSNETMRCYIPEGLIFNYFVCIT